MLYIMHDFFIKNKEIFSLKNPTVLKMIPKHFFKNFPNEKYIKINTIICAAMTYHLTYPCVRAMAKKKFNAHTINVNMISSAKISS